MSSSASLPRLSTISVSSGAYVPNGQAVGSEKYSYKLDWLRSLTEWMGQERQKYPYLALLGDYNIAPEDRDVYDPVAWKATCWSRHRNGTLSGPWKISISSTHSVFSNKLKNPGAGGITDSWLSRKTADCGSTISFCPKRWHRIARHARSTAFPVNGRSRQTIHRLLPSWISDPVAFQQTCASNKRHWFAHSRKVTIGNFSGF